MTRLRCLALAALLPACSSTPASPTPAVGPPDVPAATPGQAPTAPGTPLAPASVPDTTRYPSAAQSYSTGDQDFVRDFHRSGVLPVGSPESAVSALFGVPDSEDLYDLARLPGGEMRGGVYNTTRDRAARGEAVQIRELTWELPNGWRRKVWLHDAPGGWAVAQGMEWADDRIDF